MLLSLPQLSPARQSGSRRRDFAERYIKRGGRSSPRQKFFFYLPLQEGPSGPSPAQLTVTAQPLPRPTPWSSVSMGPRAWHKVLWVAPSYPRLASTRPGPPGQSAPLPSMYPRAWAVPRSTAPPQPGPALSRPVRPRPEPCLSPIQGGPLLPPFSHHYGGRTAGGEGEGLIRGGAGADRREENATLGGGVGAWKNLEPGRGGAVLAPVVTPRPTRAPRGPWPRGRIKNGAIEAGLPGGSRTP